MAISFACGDCAKKYKVDAKFAGKRIKCKECDATMTIPAADLSEAPPKSDLFDDWDTPETKPARKASKPAEDDFADDDDDMGEPAAPPPRVTRSAPAPRKSSSAASSDAPKKSRPKRESSGDGSPNFLIYTASGLVGGAIGAAVWGGICYATESEIGWIAWGLGALVGFCVRVASADHHDGFLPGIIAAIISVGSICAGKYMAAALLVNKVLGQLAAANPGIGNVPLGEARWVLFTAMFGAMDILFFLLAIATAFKLGSGGGDD
ncbi:MAG: hypothetical protein IT428_33455 [Planctomycetaceae bacterium]|nr:hypothetical protein [Planctomycetaceae bacterium]